MPRYAYERIAEGKSIAGMIVMRATIPVSTAIDDILLIDALSTAEEWINMVQDLPL
jgi:hypothetical protein